MISFLRLCIKWAALRCRGASQNRGSCFNVTDCCCSASGMSRAWRPHGPWCKSWLLPAFVSQILRECSFFCSLLNHPQPLLNCKSRGKYCMKITGLRSLKSFMAFKRNFWAQAFLCSGYLQPMSECLSVTPGYQFQLLANVDPRRQRMPAQILGFLSPTWEIRTEFWALDFDLARHQLLLAFGDWTSVLDLFLSLCHFLPLSLLQVNEFKGIRMKK